MRSWVAVARRWRSSLGVLTGLCLRARGRVWGGGLWAGVVWGVAAIQLRQALALRQQIVPTGTKAPSPSVPSGRWRGWSRTTTATASPRSGRRRSNEPGLLDRALPCALVVPPEAAG